MKTIHLISDIMGGMSRVAKVKTGKVSSTLHAQIEEWPADYQVKRLVQWKWFLEPLTRGFDIFSASEIVSKEKKNRCLERGYLQIGDCPNGDRVYLRDSDFSVWYWCHEETKDWDVIEADALHIGFHSVDLLLLAIRNQGYVPCDSYSAREYFQVVMFPNVVDPPN